MELAVARHWKLNLAMMWFSQLMVMTGFAALMPFIPLLFKNHIGITDEGECGLYVSYFNVAGSLAYTLFIPIWGMLSDRYGVKIMLLRGTFGTALIFPLMGFVHSAWLLIALRFITAACAGTTAAAQTLIVKNTPDNKIGFALGVFSTAFWSGAMLGNVVGGLLVNYFGYASTCIFCGVLYFIGGVSVLFAREDCKPTLRVKRTSGHVSGHGIWSFLPHLTTVVWIMLLLFAVNGFVRSFEAAYPAMLIEKITGSEKAAYWTGIISAFAAVGSMISGALFGYLSDRMDARKLLLPALAVTALMLLLQGAAESLLAFGAGRTLMCVAGGGIQPVFQKALSSITPNRKRGTVFGLSSTFNGIGTIAAAFCAGGVIYLAGTRAVFYTAALLTAIFIPVSLGLFKKVQRSPFYHKK